MKFRWLQPGYVNGCRYEAGQIVEMKPDFVPPGACEPLDAEATAAYFLAGPQPLGLVRQQWSDLLLFHYPKTFWTKSGDEWRLTGLGADLGTKKATRPMELP
jgi:hypothetical protein